ncbi:PRC-barrel domain-containing protein [Pectinatus frisingensis]|jgi:uncharacterized protein YrrD|uniref:PRC-barrel domain-containing protein n=1 Tax=Pectinatus frisingensis TaxID=865 RepID=UPI0015F3A3EF|nr:PRC-barrel domain-containing protein [Pectinatus frisingensis]
MKKNEEFLGLPIISITEGRELGVSKSLLIDAEHGCVAAIIIEDEDWYRGVKLLPYGSVVAIGHDAITITSSENILVLDDAVEFEPFLDQNIRVIGTKAITKGGTIQGIVSNIFIDDDGKIAKIVLSAQDTEEQKELSADEISIFGKEVTIIDSAVPDKVNNKPVDKKTFSAAEQIKPAISVKKTEPSETKPEKNTEQVKNTANMTKNDTKPIKSTSVSGTASTNDTTAEKTDSSVTASSAEDRHRRFLLGKKASRRITTDNGIVIVEEGADITEEILQKAKLANKFIELSMNVK